MVGAERAVAINENVVLDFSGLFSVDSVEKEAVLSPVEPILTGGKYKTLTEQEKPAEGHTEGLEGQQAKLLYLENKRQQEERERTLEVYRRYQDNTKTSSQLQKEILKGVKAGADIYGLFLKACKSISLMTSNDLFYNQVEADINAIYGEGFHHQIPLQNRINDTKKRLELLLKAQKCDLKYDSKERINKAIKAHEEQLSQLLSFK